MTEDKMNKLVQINLRFHYLNKKKFNKHSMIEKRELKFQNKQFKLYNNRIMKEQV